MHHHQPHPRDRDHRRLLVERTPLSRLRQDELLMERRRQNVSNYGSSWLKPPGVPKTLFQMREERREAEEHAEQMRREQEMAAALEAEAGMAGAGDEDGLELMEEDEDGEGGEQQDLDDEIPEAEGFGFDGEDDSDDEEQEEEEDEDEEEEGEEEEEQQEETEEGSYDDNAREVLVIPAEEEQVRDMRAAEDRMRELMARGLDNGFEAGDPFMDDEDDIRAQMLEEDDLVPMGDSHHAPVNIGDLSMNMDMDMDADLDDEIPEAEYGDGYEHTDSEEDISEDGTREISFVGGSSIRAPPSSRFRRSQLRSSIRSRASLAQSDIDISSFLSMDGSSFIADTPQTGRRRD